MNSGDASTETIRTNARRPIVRIAKWWESYFGRKSAHNFCVTNAMKNDLKDSWNIEWIHRRFSFFGTGYFINWLVFFILFNENIFQFSNVLYDRPPALFQSISLAKKHDLFYKQDYPEFMSTTNNHDNEFEATRFTYKCIASTHQLNEQTVDHKKHCLSFNLLGAFSIHTFTLN